MSDTDKLLNELRAKDVSEVTIKRVPPVASTAEQALSLSKTPLYCAESKSISKLISFQEYETLKSVGARVITPIWVSEG